MKIVFTCLFWTVLFVLSGTSLSAQNNAMNIPSGMRWTAEIIPH
ncbi:hypothetical protein ACQ86N_03730 [Puia sp. P3]